MKGAEKGKENEKGKGADPSEAAAKVDKEAKVDKKREGKEERGKAPGKEVKDAPGRHPKPYTLDPTP